MRKISFRAWDKENKIMRQVTSLFFDKDGIRGWVKAGWRKGIENNFQPGDVELMQCTGLSDKNGKEIFEGDIVKVGEMLRKVVFINAKFQLTGIDKVHNAFYGLQPSRELEVIGNIYENPELLTNKH